MSLHRRRKGHQVLFTGIDSFSQPKARHGLVGEGRFIYLKVQFQMKVWNCVKRFDHDSQNREFRPQFTRVPFFSHRAFLEAKRTAKMSGSRFFRSDRTVRSEFQNLAHNRDSRITNHEPQITNSC